MSVQLLHTPLVTLVRLLLPHVQETLDLLKVSLNRRPLLPTNVDEDGHRHQKPAIFSIHVPQLKHKGVELLVGQTVLKGAVKAHPE
jgi:hypothetical protein